MDHDIVPPPPKADLRNPAGGLLNKYDAANLQVKILCVGMFGTGKSTFLNRWTTNLKTKTRTTINLDFYEKHVDGFFPILLQDKPEAALLESPPDRNNNMYSVIDFPTSGAGAGRSMPIGGAATSQYLTTQARFGKAPSDSDLDNNSGGGGSGGYVGSPTNAMSLGAGGGSLINNNRGSTLGGTSLSTTNRLGASDRRGSGSGLAPSPSSDLGNNNAAGGGSSSNNNGAALGGDGGGGGVGGGNIPYKSYRNPRYSDSTPNASKALHKACEVAKKARSNSNTNNNNNSSTADFHHQQQQHQSGGGATDRFEVIQRSTQRKPMAECEGFQVLSAYSLTRDMGSLSGAGRSTLELYGASQHINELRRTVRDPRQVATCAMNSAFGYSYYEKKPLHVQCWDIQGQEHTRTMARTYYTDAVAALVFVDVTRPASLNDAILWREDISKKVFVKTATDSSLEGGNGGGGPGIGGGGGSAAKPVQRHARGMRAPAGARPAPTPANNAAASDSGPSPMAGSGAAYDLEEECQIPCWLVINKCDLMDPKTHQFPSKEEWLAACGEYTDLDDFCAKRGFAGWSLASGTQNVNVNGIMDRVIQQCCNQFPREIYRHSTRGKQNYLPAPKPRPKQQKKCCATK